MSNGSWVPRFWVGCCWFLPAGGVEEPLVIVHSWRRRQTHLLSIFRQPSHLGPERASASVGVFSAWSRSADASVGSRAFPLVNSESVEVSAPSDDPTEPYSLLNSNKDTFRTLFPATCRLLSGPETALPDMGTLESPGRRHQHRLSTSECWGLWERGRRPHINRFGLAERGR